VSILDGAKEYARMNLKVLADESIKEGHIHGFVPIHMLELERKLEGLATSDTTRRQLAKAVVMDMALEFTRHNA
jgi:hypothetical protein